MYILLHKKLNHLYFIFNITLLKFRKALTFSDELKTEVSTNTGDCHVSHG